MKENNEKDDNKILINTDIKAKNNKEIFDDLIKYIDSNYKNDISNENDLEIILKLNEKYSENIDITLLLDKNNNTLIQYYISKDLDNVELILNIINYYKKTLSEENPEKFYNWLINDNIFHQNFFEILIEKHKYIKY